MDPHLLMHSQKSLNRSASKTRFIDKEHTLCIAARKPTGEIDELANRLFKARLESGESIAREEPRPITERKAVIHTQYGFIVLRELATQSRCDGVASAIRTRVGSGM